jgi:hypothetical protein
MNQDIMNQGEFDYQFPWRILLATAAVVAPISTVLYLRMKRRLRRMAPPRDRESIRAIAERVSSETKTA